MVANTFADYEQMYLPIDGLNTFLSSGTRLQRFPS
jgi:hypothetical protein